MPPKKTSNSASGSNKVRTKKVEMMVFEVEEIPDSPEPSEIEKTVTESPKKSVKKISSEAADERDKTEIIENLCYFLYGITGYNIETSESFTISDGKTFYATIEDVQNEWDRWAEENGSPGVKSNIAHDELDRRLKKYFQGPFMFERETGILPHYVIADDMSQGFYTYHDLFTKKTVYIRKKLDDPDIDSRWWV